MDHKTEKNRIPWAQLIIIAAGIILYANTYEVPFYLDDFNNISDNRAIQITELSFENLVYAGTRSPLPRRPIANISFALNYYLGGSEVFGYHLVNMTIHIIAGLVLFLFFRLTLKTPALELRYRYSEFIAFWAVILWFAHPIQTQSVTYIVQRMNSMAAMFYVLAFWFYVKARFSIKWKSSVCYYAGTAFSWLLAMGCKEIAATLPFLLFLYEWIFFQKGDIAWLKRKAPYLMGLIIILLLAVIFYLGSEPWNNILQGYGVRRFSLMERVLTQFRVMFFYISLLLLPLPGRLGLEHDFVHSTTLFQPITTMISLCGVTVLVIYAFMRGKRQPLLSFSILWFFGNLVIESSVIPLEMIFEHRVYLPSMFFFLPVCAMVLQPEEVKRISVFFLVCCFVFFGSITFARNNDWKDPVGFWLKNINNSPGNARAHANLGAFYLRQGDLENAKIYLVKAIGLNQFFSPAYNNLGLVYLRQRRLPEAVKNFQRALSYSPNIFQAHLNLGGIYAEMGNFDQGIFHLKEAIRINPAAAAAHNNLANILQLLGSYQEAIYHYDEALKYNPDFEDARYNRQIAIKRMNKGAGGQMFQ
jgi:tetratricopeptide (TPR) repeat protein